MASTEAWKRAARSSYWREEDARAVIEAWRRSGDSLSAFCRANGFAAARVSRWLGRLDGAESVQFHPVRLTHEPTAAPADIEVELPGGITVRLPPGFAVEDLRRILGALGPGAGC